MGEEGFSSDSSLLYHRGLPSAIVDARAWELPDLSTTPNHPLLPQAPVAARPVPRRGLHPWGRRRDGTAAGARPTATCASPTWWPTRRAPFYRNAIGDECVYVERGQARVETVFGAFDVAHGDYLVIPRATTHRWMPQGRRGQRAAAGLLHRGQLATSARPSATSAGSASCWSTRRTASATCGCPRRRCSPRTSVRRPTCRRRSSSSTAATGPRGSSAASTPQPHHPLDVVGWDGCLYPYAFNVRDFEPITGRVHQPPPVHQVFEGANFVICNFVPAQGGLPPAVDPGALLPLQRRQRRGHVLRRRRLRGAQGLGHRQGVGLAAPRRPRARTAARRLRARRSGWSTSTSSPSWWTPSARSSSARAGVRSTTAATRGRGSVAGRAGGDCRCSACASASPAGRAGDTRRSPVVPRRCRPCGYSAEGSHEPPRRGAADTGGSTWEARVQDIRGRGARGASEAGAAEAAPRRHHAGSCWRWRRSAVWAPPRWQARHPPVRTGATTAAAAGPAGSPSA